MTSTKKIKTPQVAPLAGMSALGIKPKVKTSTKVKTTKSPELIVTDQEISHQEVWNFVQEHAGGNEGNVKIVPLSNVDLASAFWIRWSKRWCSSNHSGLDVARC
jgi:hypothetical protein